MAKSARASSRKSNNQKLKKKVFGPVETARTERLSAKLLELAAQQLPPQDPANEKDDATTEYDADSTQTQLKSEATEMDIDGAKPAKVARGRKRIEKRRSRKSSIVFSKYKDRVAKHRK